MAQWVKALTKPAQGSDSTLGRAGYSGAYLSSQRDEDAEIGELPDRDATSARWKMRHSKVIL